MAQRPTYVFENGKAYAFISGQAVASADSIEELQKMAWNDPSVDPYEEVGENYGRPDEHHVDQSPFADEPQAQTSECPRCHEPNGVDETGQCGACGHDVHDVDRGLGQPNDPYAAEGGGGEYEADPYDGPDYGHAYSHVVTPNGLKGKVLGRTQDVWGDYVRVRFENGHIAQLHVSDETKFVNDEEEVTADSPVEDLRSRLDTQVVGDKESLTARASELRAIKVEATTLIREAGVTEADTVALDSIIVEATHEVAEVSDALEYLATSESFIPSAPFQASVVEQASLGRDAGNWLDVIVADTIAEAESTDFQKLIDEGPEAFVAELDSAPLADQGVTRQMAASYIRTRTAGVQDDELRDKYETMWLSRVEEVRRTELASRKTKTHKEASVEHDEHASLPDDILFG